ncbi:hypothetical protein [Dyella tabacisoli]|uniref:TULIP family P47-like protein n=1 Tax=Dyella tabacisoli TaxID=2282381 RepID=A0A369UIR3_9GAMM|nr:hypothetical protein [Dyella tabacisoli]RDD80436.1 hypothetical protein DVJ77_17535 [Dyella tabacisoli]
MPASAATLSNLLQQMYQNKEVLQGWDAVMNMLESSVNGFFQLQWNRQTGNAGKLSISVVWCESVLPIPHGQGYFTNVTEFDVDLGAPLFQFTSGRSEVTVRQNILRGSTCLGTMEVPANFNPATCNLAPHDPRVTWGKVQSVDVSQQPYLSGTVSLQQVQGLVGSAHSLVLNFAQGAFTLNALTIVGVNNTTLVNQLKSWFATQNIRYLLASVDFQNLSGIPGLTPTAFRFNVLTTNAGNTIVQLLITTNGSAPSSTVINVNEPIPTADGLNCTLMLNSRLLYQDVLVRGFNGHGGSFSLIPLGPNGGYNAWYATINPRMHFEGSFSYGNCCDRTTVTYSVYLGGNYTGTATEGFALSQEIHTQGNAPVDITVSARYPVRLSGSGPNQSITITPGTPSVTVSGGAEDEMKSRLEDILNNNIRNAMAGVSFTPVTYFALKNLLFPGNLISMSQIQVPADMLIAGNFSLT